MNDPTKLPSPDPQQRVAHETTDVSPSYVGLFALGLVLLIALVFPLIGWVFWKFEAAAEREDPRQSALTADQTPPSPRLESDPAAELTLFRHKEQQRLSTYGWIDLQERVVHIPIERAIEILSERGLPEPEGPNEAANEARTP